MRDFFHAFRKHVIEQSYAVGIGLGSGPTVNYTLHTTAEKLACPLNYW